MMNTVRPSRRLGIIGSVVGLLALVASALTQMLPAAVLLEPLSRTTEEARPKGTDHLIFHTKRLEIRSREAAEQRSVGNTWEQGLSTAVVALGLLAITLAVFAVILREEKLLAGVAAALGAAAIAVQVFWVLILVALAIVIVSAILS